MVKTHCNHGGMVKISAEDVTMRSIIRTQKSEKLISTHRRVGYEHAEAFVDQPYWDELTGWPLQKTARVKGDRRVHFRTCC